MTKYDDVGMKEINPYSDLGLWGLPYLLLFLDGASPPHVRLCFSIHSAHVKTRDNVINQVYNKRKYSLSHVLEVDE